MIKDTQNENNGEPFEAMHEAIISEELFYSVQKILDAEKRNKEKPKKDRELYFLKDGFYCPICNEPMTAYGARSHTGRIYHYYSCQRGCFRKRIEVIEYVYADYLKSLKPKDDLVAMLKQMSADIYEENSRQLTIDNERFRKDIAELKERKNYYNGKNQ